MTTKTYTYRAIPESEIPDGVRFDVTRRNQGQIIEVAYGGKSRYEHGEGDRYQRVLDRSMGPDAYTFYRRVDAQEGR